MPAASGALAEVPVCSSVHILLRSVVIICCSWGPPELYVEAKVEEHASEYLEMESRMRLNMNIRCVVVLIITVSITNTEILCTI